MVAIASVAVIEAIQYNREWRLAQRFYLARHIQTGLAGKLRKAGYYTLLTVVDGQRAGQHEPGDVVRYTKGSKARGIEAREYARVRQVDRDQNLITIERASGERQSYDPRRLQGVALYRKTEWAFAEGDRVQFTAPYREQHIANRDLATVEKIEASGEIRIRLDSGREVQLNLRESQHLDYGYAVTSHSSQGQTADRLLIHVDTEQAHLNLINRRMGYVPVSRRHDDTQIYTNDRANLGEELSRDVSHRTAIEQGHAPEPAAHKIEPASSESQEKAIAWGHGIGRWSAFISLALPSRVRTARAAHRVRP